MIAFGDSLPDADGAMIKLTRKCRRKSLFSLQDTVALSPREELPTGVAQPSMSSYRHTETTFFSLLAVEEMLIIQVTVQLTSVQACTSSKTLFRGTNNNNIPSVIPQVGSEFQGKVGMKFSTVLENEELCISVLLESSGNFWMNSVVLDLAYFYSLGPPCLSCNFHFLPPKLQICDNPCCLLRSLIFEKQLFKFQ